MCIGFYMYVYSDGMFVSVCVCVSLQLSVYLITTIHLWLHTEQQQSMLKTHFIAEPVLNIIEK